jgi:hypothetical protein
MDSKPKLKKSVVAALIGVCFFAWFFVVSMDTPFIYYMIIFGGILLSCSMSFYYGLAEQRSNPKCSSVGIWIAFGVLVLFLLFCVILPGLG